MGHGRTIRLDPQISVCNCIAMLTALSAHTLAYGGWGSSSSPVYGKPRLSQLPWNRGHGDGNSLDRCCLSRPFVMKPFPRLPSNRDGAYTLLNRSFHQLSYLGTCFQERPAMLVPLLSTWWTPICCNIAAEKRRSIAALI